MKLMKGLLIFMVFILTASIIALMNGFGILVIAIIGAVLIALISQDKIL